MNDPYQVLGVDRSASEDEIKKAYRRLSRTYHPDSNIGKSEREKAIAEEKFKEIQTAYKSIMDGTAGAYSYNGFAGSTGGGRSGYGGFNGFGGFGGFGYNQNRNGSYSTSSERDANYYRVVESFLRNRMYAEAMRSLNEIRSRDGRWYFYASMASSGMGNLVDAERYINKAIEIEPGNMEYRHFQSRMSDIPGWYTEAGRNYGAPDIQNNNLCCYLCLASAMCGGPCGVTPLFCCL